jgi:hypothetical protein
MKRELTNDGVRQLKAGEQARHLPPFLGDELFPAPKHSPRGVKRQKAPRSQSPSCAHPRPICRP